ncbi:MAG: dihydrofolate reductase family protein [Geodermatophilaceae bacterium]
MLRKTDSSCNPRHGSSLTITAHIRLHVARSSKTEGRDIRFRQGHVADHLPEILAAAQGKKVRVLGGGDLAGQFLDADALDEITLTVVPVAVTGGAPLPHRWVIGPPGAHVPSSFDVL